MVELKGTLGGIGLPAIAQLIGELQHSGRLELTRADRRGVLGFDDGRLVSAMYEDEQGMQALATIVARLADGSFRFVEGVPPGERTLDFGGADLQRHLARLAGGESADTTLALAAQAEPLEPSVCPRLGFADDPTRHYSRPTALHRCYASVAPSLVTVQEQRELCLGGRYVTCARFRTAQRSRRAAAASGPAPAGAPPPSPGGPIAAPLPQHAARIAARPGAPVLPRVDAAAPPKQDGAGQTARRGGRRPPLIVGAGVAALVGLAAVALWLMQPDVGARPSGASTTSAAPTFLRDPVATAAAAATATAATPGPIAGGQATAAPGAPPTLAPVPLASPAVAGVTTAPPDAAGASRQGAAPNARALLDVRFASGNPRDWVDNAPYAAWSDGAYRLQAKQAARFVAVAVPVPSPLADVLVSATFRKTGGPPGGGYGVILRDQGPGPRDGVNQRFSGYVFETGDLGEFGAWRRDVDRWIDLVPWAHSTVVRPGGSPNELVVSATGNHLVFTVNSVQLADLHDETWSSGGIGIFVGGDFNEVAVDHFSVQPPD